MKPISRTHDVFSVGFAFIVIQMGGLPRAPGDERWINFVVAAGTLAAIPLVFFILWSVGEDAVDDAVTVDGIACEEYSFNQEAWDQGVDTAEREEEARGLERCRDLIGKSRDEVTSMLGRARLSAGDGRQKEERFIGTVNDGLGPGDDQTMTIAYDRDGLVIRVQLTFPARDPTSRTYD